MKVVDEMFAIVAVNDDGHEGVVAEMFMGAWMPLVFSDQRLVGNLKIIGTRIAKQEKRTLRLIRLSGREVLQTFGETEH